jgi:phosphonopyruvate decarboxylase
VNPLTSLLDPLVYAIPALLLIGWRGRPGTTDEPQHARMGLVTEPLLGTIGVACSVAPATAEDMAVRLRDVQEHFTRASAPYALLFPSGIIGGASADAATPAAGSLLTREAAIEVIVEVLPAGAAVVCTTGKASRELDEIRARRPPAPAMDFLTVGSMGFAAAIAHGMALAQPERRIVAIDGDGAALMHLGVLATIGHYRAPELVHVVLDNGRYESTGGATVSRSVRFDDIARASGYASAAAVTTAAELRAALAADDRGPRLIVAHVAPGTRADLGRPRRTPLANKRALMAYLAERRSRSGST